jgi:translation initiation factor IF-3
MKNRDEKTLTGWSIVKSFDKVRIVKSEVADGIMDSKAALDLAKSVGLDFFCINSTNSPALCVIGDYGRYIYEKSKKDKLAKQKSKAPDLKEIKLSPSIAENDFQTKLRQAVDFLKKGHPLKVSLQFKGRQMAHKEIGFNTVNRFVQSVLEYSKVQSEPKLEGRNIYSTLVPLKK